MYNTLVNRYFLIIVSVILLAVASFSAVGFAAKTNSPLYTAENAPTFANNEVGFEETTEHPDEAEVSEKSPIPNPIQTITSFISGSSRWARWWMDFTDEERKYYESQKRAPGPARVGIQAGHWKNSEVPDELSGLKRNGGGASGGGKVEVDVVLEIAKKVKTLLEAKGVVVDLLPATLPVDYVTDAFVSIHADGSTSSNVSGFKIASPQRDFSGKSVDLVKDLYESYGKVTNLDQDKNITRRMSGYYAFNWRRYDHALSPLTPAAIVETGFLTSATDRKIIVSNQNLAAEGIANGILRFLADNELL